MGNVIDVDHENADPSPPVPAPVPAPAPAPAPAPEAGANTGAPTGAPGLGLPRTVALALGGAATIGLSVGTYFGVRAISEYDASKSHCDSTGCDDTGIDRRQASARDGDAATVAFSISAGLLVGGVVLWLTAPSHAANRRGLVVAPSFADRRAGLAVGGSL